MADHLGSWKICATCVYWIARRDADFTALAPSAAKIRADVPFPKTLGEMPIPVAPVL